MKLALALILFAGALFGAPARVNSVTAQDISGSTIASLATAATSHTGGNLLFVYYTAHATGTVPATATVTDTAGNTYINIGYSGYDTHNITGAFYAKNITGNASNVVTLTPASVADFVTLNVIQYSGLSTTAPLDFFSAKEVLGSFKYFTTSAYATQTASEVVLFCVHNDGGFGVTYSPVSPTTATTVTNTSLSGVLENIISTAQSGTGVISSGSTLGNWDGMVVTFSATAITTANTITADDGKIIYTGRWGLTGSGASARATTITAGSYLDVYLSSAPTIVVEFDSTGLLSTGYPDVVYQVDGGPVTRQTLDSTQQGMKVPIAFPVAGLGGHWLRVWCAGISEGSTPALNQWTSQQGACIFKDIITGGGAGATLTASTPVNTAEFLGDSIVATVRMLSDCGGGSNSNATCMGAHQSWATQTCTKLGLRCVMSGYGGSGLTVTGSGSVPIANTSFASNYSGSVYSPAQKPIVVVVEQGTNDGGASSGTFQTALTTYLQTIRAAYSKAVIFCVGLPSNTHAADMATVVAAMADSRMFYLNYTSGVFTTTAGVDTTDGTHPNLSGSAKIAAKLSSDIQTQLSSLGVTLSGGSSARTCLEISDGLCQPTSGGSIISILR